MKFFYLDKVLAHYRVRTAGNLSAIESEPEMKKKNLELFIRIGRKLNQEEWKGYRFEKIMKALKFKTAMTYLMVGEKEPALNFLEEKPILKAVAHVLPGKWLKFTPGLFRVVGHRFLLRRI